mmetsp:Transcript_1537/g.3897  ORF Transcript_1537/g.3897 Transcript_1537/m.3897 type:complete len:103 (-) Transcript_1537:77-385(-)
MTMMMRDPPHQPDLDSSHEELEDVVGAAEHEGGRAAAECSETSDWVRDDNYGVDERARQGFTDQSGPRISGLSDWENSSLFSFALHQSFLYLLLGCPQLVFL